MHFDFGPQQAGTVWCVDGLVLYLSNFSDDLVFCSAKQADTAPAKAPFLSGTTMILGNLPMLLMQVAILEWYMTALQARNAS